MIVNEVPFQTAKQDVGSIIIVYHTHNAVFNLLKPCKLFPDSPRIRLLGFHRVEKRKFEDIWPYGWCWGTTYTRYEVQLLSLLIRWKYRLSGEELSQNATETQIIL